MTYNLAFLARKINDGELPVYRYIYLICAEGKFLNFVDKSFFADSLEKQIEKFRLINNIFKKISDYLREKEDYINYLREKEDYIKIIESGHGWRLLTKYFKIRDKLLPIGTRKREIVRLVFQAILNIISGNLRGSIYKETRLLFRNIKEIAARRYPSFQNLENVYELWIEKEEPKEEDLINQRLSRFFIEPKISIIVPTFNPAEHFLRDMIESVLNQTYSNWELCIAEGGNKEGHVRKILKEYSEKDSRVKIRVLDENKSIAGNSNKALSIASGEYIAFLDHEDRLPRFALFEVVKAINQNPHTDFLYSDEDKIDERGKRRDPFFKPDWSPNMFLSFNYLGHLCVIRKKLLDKVEGFREGYDGSYDYDLFLRVIEFTVEKRITHIPRILYHCRITYGSAAGSNLGKAYDYASAKKALRDAMERRAVEIEDVTDGICAGSYRIKYKIIGNPKVSILIPTKDYVKILKTCIASILSKTDYDNYEIVIIDNESREEKTFKYYDEMKKNSKIKIIEYNKPFNFSAINNFAASRVNSKYILFLNNDTEVISREWVGAMLEHAQRDEVGAVGAKLVYPNNKIQHVGVILGLGPHEVAGHPYYKYPNQNGYFGRINIIANYSALTAACLMVRKEVFEEVGGFEENFSHAYNDVDLCMKIRQKGYLIVWTLYAELYHHESKSRGYEDTPEKQERFRKEIVLFQQRWGDVLQKGDPYYNPNLSLRREDFSIKL